MELSSELINKILEEIGLEPIENEYKDNKNEDLREKRIAPKAEKMAGKVLQEMQVDI